MKKRKSAAEALRRYPPFSALPESELSLIDRTAYVTDAPAGTTLLQEGHLGQQFMILLEGAAEVSRDGVLIAKLGPGDTFGEMSLLENQPTNASVTISEPSKVAVFGVHEFGDVLRGAPIFIRQLLVELSSRLRRSENPPGGTAERPSG